MGEDYAEKYRGLIEDLRADHLAITNHLAITGNRACKVSTYSRAMDAIRELIESHRAPGPHAENLARYIAAHRRTWPDAVSIQLPASLADEFLAGRGPDPPALRVRGDSRTDDAGRWQDLESGVDA